MSTSYGPKTFISLDPIYGREMSAELLEDGSRRCEVMVYPGDDICLSDSITVEFFIPADFATRGGVKVRSKDGSALKLSSYFSPERGEFVFPWLDSARYPLSVWFFTVRHTLTRGDHPPWSTPISLKSAFPIRPGNGEKSLIVTRLVAGSGRARGKRSYMEDVDISFPSISINDRVGSSASLYAVFDGHGGSECSSFVSEELPTKLTTSLRAGVSFPEALFYSFVETDKEFLSFSKSNAGSTGNVLLWDNSNYLGYLGNVGDTRTVLSRAGNAVDLTRDQKASDSIEVARIARAGGFVANGRVNGSLAVARAFGDCHLKDITGRSSVVAEPEITTFRPLEEDQFAIIASDGLWDVMTSQAAVSFVIGQLERFGVDLELIRTSEAKELNSRGLDQERIQSELTKIADIMATNAYRSLLSQDNITVTIVIFLRSVDVPGQGDLSLGSFNSGANYHRQPARRVPAGNSFNSSSSSSSTSSSSANSSSTSVSTSVSTSSSGTSIIPGADRTETRSPTVFTSSISNADYMQAALSAAASKASGNSRDDGDGGTGGDRKGTSAQASADEDSMDEEKLMDFLLDDSNF